MNEVEEIYNNGKLLVRAMDFPQLKKGEEGLEYDCSTWANEFCMLNNGTFSSISTTLLVPGVGVSTYKNIGFLIDSDLANCFHIAKSDSGSSGNTSNGDFFANQADFQTIDELANYINTDIESVRGLFFNECPKQDLLLQMTDVARSCLKNITGIEYPIYSYDSNNGRMNQIELTKELEEQIIQNLKTDKVFYWPETYESPIVDEIKSAHNYTI